MLEQIYSGEHEAIQKGKKKIHWSEVKLYGRATIECVIEQDESAKKEKKKKKKKKRNP